MGQTNDKSRRADAATRTRKDSEETRNYIGFI